MAKTIIEFKCEKCGKPQEKDKQKSNNNFSVFNTKEKCNCGGEFKMYMNGELMN